MDQTASFAAELVRAGAGAYAGFAASALLEQAPDLKTRYGRRAFAAWKAELERLLLDLAAALEAGEPTIFADQVAWSRDAFLARDMDAGDLRAALTRLRDTLAEELPEAARPPAVSAISGAIAHLDRPGRRPAHAPVGALASAYLLRTLEGDRRGAVALVLDAVQRAEIDTNRAYTDVLIPAQRQVGEMWHRGEVNVAEEHFTTMTTQTVMAVLSQRATPKAANGRTVLAGAVAGDAHDLGVRAVADLFELDGWRAIFLGADVPTPDLAQGVEAFEPDLLVLSASLPTQIPAVERTIKTVRRTEAGRKARILVGGGAFARLADAHTRVGADAVASSLDEAVTLGDKLVGLDAQS